MALWEVSTFVAEDYVVEAETEEQAVERAIEILHARLDDKGLQDEQGYVDAVEFVGDSLPDSFYDVVERKEEVS